MTQLYVRRMMLCMTQLSPTLTPKQAAERLKAAGVPCSDETVRRWVKAGRLAGAIVLPSGRIRIPVERIDAITKGGGTDVPVEQAATDGRTAREAAEVEATQAQAEAPAKGLTPVKRHQ